MPTAEKTSAAVERAQKQYDEASRRMQEAYEAIDSYEGSDDAEVTALEETFNDAEAEAARCKDNLSKAQARSRSAADHPAPVDTAVVRDGKPVENDQRAQAEIDDRVARVVNSGEDQRRSVYVANAEFRRMDIKVLSEPLTYDRYSPNSYFGDLYKRAKYGDPAASERLGRHAREIQHHLEAERRLAYWRGPDNVEGEKRAINSTSGTGGEFVPPLWLNQEFIHFLRAARPTADVVNHMPLPEHTNSINFPKVTGGTAVAAQSDGGAVQSTDATTGSLTVPVCTIAGQQDMSRQLLERSIPGMDRVIMEDLVLAYNVAIDTQVLSGSGSGANATGIFNTSSIGSVTYTDASPDYGGSGKLNGKLGSAYSTVNTARFLPPDAIVMHPRRWAWIATRFDSQNRPLVVPQVDGNQAVNADGTWDRVVSQARGGVLLGLPVVLDPNIPTNSGASTNQDTILVMRSQDQWLMEDSAGPYTRVYEEVLSGNLQIRVQLYSYFAFTAGRYPSGICTITGTGLVTPSF